MPDSALAMAKARNRYRDTPLRGRSLRLLAGDEQASANELLALTIEVLFPSVSTGVRHEYASFEDDQPATPTHDRRYYRSPTGP
jgi:hypothetical protein